MNPKQRTMLFKMLDKATSDSGFNFGFTLADYTLGYVVDNENVYKYLIVKYETTPLLKSYITKSCKRLYKDDYLLRRDKVLDNFNQMLAEKKAKSKKNSSKKISM